ncbi:hypothetical protein [Pseudoalteromonas obscura]|uniref:Uncharacterized protein n=1 Tax=Pseudoalteromonas obscura TaxID=3048491 RepID=A0ABT7EHB3_9GAMM|nr:hypothetical protein [Pseudoalteromonas sp. P94(2023)]MDK2594430.1 hypothetical protein [Pseudoalteromonas sp. P94(2023)]
MTPNYIQKVLRDHALNAGMRSEQSYLPTTKEEAENFKPHNWVMQATGQLATTIASMDTLIKSALEKINHDPLAAKDILVRALPSVVKLEQVQVEKDSNGYWTHDDLPFWESSTADEIDCWLMNQGLMLYKDYLQEGSDLYQSYYNKGENNISSWEPECHVQSAFLISIHETDSGPVAWFAIPLTTHEGS